MPDSTPAYSLMEHRDDWSLMYHGAAHLSYVEAGGLRGASDLFAPNWAMIRATRMLDCDSQLELAGMFSLDPATVGGFGYPSLFQTGESWQGLPLHDRQHPHNYFMDLSLKYKRLIDCDSAWYVYLAPVGEPALGPPAFMHRTLALDYALSPIGHHWQDATHIAYGVATAGVQSREWQLEGSLFNGREPGEDRAAIESPTFDSYSGRVTWNPGKNLSMQVSQGWLKEPEILHPGVDVTRTTASLVYNHDLGCARNWQTAVVWGRNSLEGEDFDSYLLESGLKQDGGWSPYFRLEQVTKSADELVLPDSFDHDERFTIRQGTFGATYDLNDGGDYLWGLGASYTFSFSPSALDLVYGADPSSWQVYLRVHPRRSGHDREGASSVELGEHVRECGEQVEPGSAQAASSDHGH